jgi:mannose-6-phosphate isomerase-like protein (cupin superfamily)
MSLSDFNRKIVFDRLDDAVHCRTSWGEESHTRISSQDTAGTFAMMDYYAPAGFGPPRHVHHREDEIFQVLEGTAVVWTHEKVYAIGAGDAVFLPIGRPHTWRAYGPDRLHLSVSVIPGGFEDFFPSIVRSGLNADDIEGLAKVAASVGIEVIGPPLNDDEVCAILKSSQIRN